MRFKGEMVYVHTDESGRPVLDSAGRAEMKYRESDSKSYRPHASNLIPDDGPPPSAVYRAAKDAAPASGNGSAPAAVKKPRPKAAPGGAAVEIWTDGACSGNPGPMGIGVVVIDGAHRKEKGEYLGIGTNNIAELTAVERGIDLVGAVGADKRLRVYTDSSYVIGVLSKGWKAKANQELIAKLKRKLAPLNLDFVKVAGHAGVPENERCDELAREAITGRSR
jgi:ribonuclease HI